MTALSLSTSPSNNSALLGETISTYLQEYVEFSSTVEPLAGEQHISPGENFDITLTATNDPYFPTGGSGGVRLVNVRWHVSVVSPATSLVVPEAPLDCREGPSDDLPLLTPGDTVQEMYVFPRFEKKNLAPGETDRIELQGYANAEGTILIMFDLVADIDADWLDLTDQTSSSLAALGTNSVVDELEVGWAS